MAQVKSTVGRLNPFDVVAGILVYSSLKGRDTTGHPTDEWRVEFPDVYSALFHLRRRYPELLSGFVFRERGIGPYCQRLEGILASLGAAHIVSVDNPAFKFLRLECDQKDHLQRELEAHSNQQNLHWIKTIAREFDRFVLAKAKKNPKA